MASGWSPRNLQNLAGQKTCRLRSLETSEATVAVGRSPNGNTALGQRACLLLKRIPEADMELVSIEHRSVNLASQMLGIPILHEQE
jgi:hypothetical protein